MTDKHSDPTALSGQETPGDMIDAHFDRLSAALEASYDRIGARFERAMCLVTFWNLLVFAIAAMVLLW